METSTNGSKQEINNNALGTQTDLFCLVVQKERTREERERDRRGYTNYSECRTICERGKREKEYFE